MKRVAIIGCPGAGKTTFSLKLASKTGLPIIHLDYYYHKKKYNFYSDREAWIKMVKELIKQDEWIMDGNYSSSFDVRFKRADTIIFFDFPKRTSLLGTLKRRIHYRNKKRVEMPSDWEEKANVEFLKYVWNFNKDPRERIIYSLDKNKNKEVVIFKNRKQAQAYLDTV